MTDGADSPEPLLALGIDAGGTETRWALARTPDTIVREGQPLPPSPNAAPQAAPTPQPALPTSKQ